MNKEKFRYKYCYKITCTSGSLKDHFYFGQHQTNNLDDGYKGRGRILTDYYKKYPNDYIMEIISFCDTVDELDKLEYDLIHPYLNDDMCLNLIDGGHVNRMSDKLKQKISERTKEAMNNDEIRAKCANGGKTNKGKKKPDGFGQKLSEYYSIHGGNCLGKKLWPNGRSMSDTTKKNMSESAKKAWKQKTDEERERHSLTQTAKMIGRRVMNNGEKNKFIKSEDIDKYLSEGWKFGFKHAK